MTKRFKYQFVDLIPDKINQDIIYISTKYKSAIHLCACGCGNEVVTTLSPCDWCVIFDGNSVGLYPSIGNWGLPCRSHYWILNNNVRWAPKWTQEQVASRRRRAKQNREFGNKNN